MPFLLQWERNFHRFFMAFFAACSAVVHRCFLCGRGIAAVEFAIIAPVFLLLLMGIIEFSLIMFTTSMLESATAVSSRLGKTGYSQSGMSREDTILQAIRTQAGSTIDSKKITITSKYYTQFDQIGKGEPWTDTNHNGIADPGEYTDINGNGKYDADLGTAGYGGANDVVVYTISYPWSVVTPFLRELIGTKGIFTITTHAVVKNEPY